MLHLIKEFDKNYKVERKIGSGGMGDVYLATDKRLDRSVAVKVLKINNIDNLLNRNEFIDRFRHEAKSVAKLSHPNIVGIYDFGNQDDTYYMIMEYLEGSNLTKLIKNSKHKIPYTLVVNIGIQMCNALQYAHDNKVIHRDVKPENIILNNNGIVKLTDFGIVLMAKDIESKNNDIVGSILYSSPEQLHDSSSVNEKSDLYSLGVTLYEMLTGKNPFNKEEISDSIKSIMFDIPESPSNIYTEIPIGLSNIILKSLEKKSNDRYNNVKEMKKELSAFADQETILENSYIDVDNKPSLDNNLNGTIRIKNTLVASSDYKSITQRTGINKESTIIKKNFNIKNYSWINNISQINQGIKINSDYTKISINKILNNNKKFSGFIFIDNDIILFLYKGLIYGAINISKGEVGNNVYKNLPDKFDSLIYKESNSNEILPLIISNLITSGLEIYKDLDNINTNLRDFLRLLLYKEDRFDGFIEISKEKIPKKSILYVEDDRISQLLLSKYLKENDSPYELFISESVNEALERVKVNKYDLIILDYFLGDSTAKDFIKKYHDVPIVLTTSSNNSDILLEMLKEGVKDYITKDNTPQYFKRVSTIIDNIIGTLGGADIGPKNYYIAYKDSIPVISLITDNNGTSETKESDIFSDFDLDYCSLNIYAYSTDILTSSIPIVMKNITLDLDKKDKKIAGYNFFIESNEHLTLDLESKIKNNLDIKIISNHKEQPNIDQIVLSSLYYKAMNWLIKDYFPLINHSNKNQEMSIIYENLTKINNIRFFVDFSGKEIPIVLYNNDSPSIFATFGNGDTNSINSFIENSIDIKKSLGHAEALIYISTEMYDNKAIDLFNKYTKPSAFSLFTRKSNQKGIIKVDDKKKLQLNLIHYNVKTNNFDSVLPPLF